MPKVKTGLGLLAVATVLLALTGCSGEGDPPTAVESPTPTPSVTAEESPTPTEEPERVTLEDACRTALDVVPFDDLLPSSRQLVLAAGELEDVIEAANNVDVTFALAPMVEALNAQATAANGQPMVEARQRFLAAVEELDAGCRPVGVRIIR